MSDLEIIGPYDEETVARNPRRHLPLPQRPDHEAAPADAAPGAPAPPEDAQERTNPGPVPWRAAASSVPRLRQQPVAPPDALEGDPFPGFAQDALVGRGEPRFDQRLGAEPAFAGGDAPAADSPLAADLPWWEACFERVSALPRPVTLGIPAALLLAALLVPVLRPSGGGEVSLARIVQHPEAFDGRKVQVRGTAGETFSIGGGYVFHLRQGRDTIVVYSHTRKPALDERLRTTGTISIGYLDGVPRVALLEDAPAN